MKNFIFTSITFLLFTLPISLFAITGTAVNNGNWSASSSWSFGRPPGNNDTIVVPSGKTINININSPVYTNMVLIVHGTLYFNNGQKLNFDCNSIVSVATSGLLDGGNPGSKIDMCGSTVWRGPGPDSGPLVYGYNPLPINLLSFTAHVCGDEVCLSWTTLTEANNDYFTVEKTKDGEQYDLVEHVKGAGNSSSLKNYTSNDYEPFESISYYRLKQTDYNGAFKFYYLREINRGSKTTTLSLNVFPNPSKTGDINLRVVSEPEEKISIAIFDLSGKEIYSKEMQTESGKYVSDLPLSIKLKKGAYLITGTSDKKVSSKKIVIN